MTLALFIQLAMFVASVCYGAAALAYVADGKPFMAATMTLYATSVWTVWLAGKA